mmetsp:Transcript_35576/g.98499  ORF Transcript_35576/g.98499 Transcript_35576/m.98499 type:complete len:330 (-) Transcript_35576:500-1489(-)
MQLRGQVPWQVGEKRALLRVRPAPLEEVPQVAHHLLHEHRRRLDAVQVHVHRHHVLFKGAPPFRQLGVCLSDLGNGDREEGECQEHEYHHVQPLRGVGRGHLRRHRAHHPERPVEAEHVRIPDLSVCPAPLRPLHGGPVGHLRPRPARLLGEENLSGVPCAAHHPPQAGVPVADAEDGQQHADQRDDLQEHRGARGQLGPLPDGGQLCQPQHAHHAYEPDARDDFVHGIAQPPRQVVSDLEPGDGRDQVQAEPPALHVPLRDLGPVGDECPWLFSVDPCHRLKGGAEVDGHVHREEGGKDPGPTDQEDPRWVVFQVRHLEGHNQRVKQH